MDFTWDEAKNEINIRKHGLDFADVHEVFDGPVLEKFDDRFDYGEERWIAIGLLRGILCVVVIYAEPRKGAMRIISFRKGDRHERVIVMKGKPTSKPSRTDWDRVTQMKDEEIDYSDIPPLRDDFFKEAHVRWSGNKKQVTLRIDPDVIEFFKKQGKGYQSMINAVLRKYVEAHNH